MEQGKKRRVGIITSSLLARTGFSNNARALLPYLYKTDKYELFHLNQGITDTPEFQRYPWNNEGALKNGTFDVSRFQSQDEGYKRHVSYGNLAAEQFILNNKLDVIIAAEDGWAFDIPTYTNAQWWQHLKDNFLLWTTIDSLNILPMYKEWAEKSNNFWVWASFAEKAMKQEDGKKYGHVQTVPGCLDTKDYYPILRHEKIALRKKFNIDPNTIIFLQLGRGQLRKLFPQTIESFGRFKKQNPNINSKLLLFMGWYEGWPYERLIQEAGLKREDVLAPYFCKNCHNWEVKPYEGEFKDCRFCGAKGQAPSQNNPNGGGQKTCGVDSTITNAEMSYVYGLCDAAVSAFTSGGLEFFNVESLLCGLPLLCTDYSCGTDFTCNDFVFPLDGTYTYEVGTGFKKHVPNLNTMIKFYEKICLMPEEKRKEIGRKGRDWALKTFDVSIVGKKLEEWIDSRKPIEWDYKYKFEPKDPNAQIENIQDNKDFIKQCYKKILNMEVKDDDSGLLYWMGFLSDTKNTRDNMVNYFRSIAVQENQKNNVQQVDFSEFLIKNGKKHLLIVLKESIGDLIMSTALLESFRKNYPRKNWNIYFATSSQFKEIFDANPNIDKVLDYQPFMESELACTGQWTNKGWFDAYCHLGNSMQHKLNYLTNSNINLPISLDYLTTNSTNLHHLTGVINPLPVKLDIGRKAKITAENHTWHGWEGKIVEHYINYDHCGSYGQHTYCIMKDNGEKFSVRVEDCELIDGGSN